ncbi:uncharacterized protein CMU_027490 [Cryptosporidium muris RN66]|uniref:Uncharacterized protein n=1 Tax=Cryptosporidium muris (strain RN66) TaxID=441375 RepID=B6ABI7_CRYMR|nr:uncharacterized protein CMU_027490 [Cryptosporidium muris RN66]EEA05739.1 hypothetical protein, conserved [Cryptosporidium muris RN66]|eukprot:XP_002140088.1 hypothetical protein [Cryptosporidium muris RN66]
MIKEKQTTFNEEISGAIYGGFSNYMVRNICEPTCSEILNPLNNTDIKGVNSNQTNTIEEFNSILDYIDLPYTKGDSDCAKRASLSTNYTITSPNSNSGSTASSEAFKLDNRKENLRIQTLNSKYKKKRKKKDLQLNTITTPHVSNNNKAGSYSTAIDLNSKEFRDMPTAMQRKFLQMLRNRQSAQKHRDKQKIERQQLRDENIALHAKVVALSNELQDLKSKTITIAEHEAIILHLKNNFRQISYFSGSLNNNKSKADVICNKSQGLDCDLEFIALDDYPTMNIWSSVCDTTNFTRVNSGTNIINSQNSADSLLWIGTNNAWSKQDREVEDLLANNK